MILSVLPWAKRGLRLFFVVLVILVVLKQPKCVRGWVITVRRYSFVVEISNTFNSGISLAKAECNVYQK